MPQVRSKGARLNEHPIARREAAPRESSARAQALRPRGSPSPIVCLHYFLLCRLLAAAIAARRRSQQQ